VAASRGRPARRRAARRLALAALPPLATGLCLAFLPEKPWVRARHLDELALPASLASLGLGALLAWLAGGRRRPTEDGSPPGPAAGAGPD
jgi:hypothetical protein